MKDVNYYFYSGTEGCAVSFNGGKDCTAMLDLISRCWPQDTPSILVCYVAQEDSFPEIEEFISNCAQRY